MQPEFNSRNIKVIIGLGNPGKDYVDTYHNAGFLFIDQLEANSSIPKHKLIKSGNFMNDSGSYVAELVKKWKIAKPEETLVVHDDSDITLGSFKLSFGSSSAGHKGVESVIKALGTKDFWRLRIGIRPLGPRHLEPSNLTPRKKAGDFVMKPITKTDRKILEEVFEKIRNQLALI